jgi:hypothetical protein
MSADEHGGITDLATAYLQGVYRGDTATLGTLFDQHAQVYGEINGLPYHKTIAAYLEGVASRQSPLQLGEPYRMRILSIDSLGSIAVVKLHSPMLGLNYQLFLTLRQLEGKWSIVNKTFSHIKQD